MISQISKMIGRDFIYCPSYSSIFFALYRKKIGADTNVITSNQCIQKFCVDFGITVYFFKYDNAITSLNPIKSIIIKKHIDKFIKSIGYKNTDQFFLFDNAYDIYGFYIAKTLAKIGNVHFHLLGYQFPLYISGQDLCLTYSSLISRAKMLKLIWNLDLIYYSDGGIPIYGINNEFLNKHNISHYLLEKDLTELKFESLYNFQIQGKKYNLLIVLQGGEEIINVDELYNIYQKIGFFSKSLIVKFHPRPLKNIKKSNNELKLEKFEQVPECIPVELFLNNIEGSVISLYSSVLPFAACINGIKAISLLDLVEWHSIDFREEIRDWLIQESGNRIFFPKTIEELFTMIG